MAAEQNVVGIDLGTTYSAVAVFRRRIKAEVVQNLMGHRTTPSCYAVAEDGVEYVGEAALSAKEMDKRIDMLFDSKRLLGRCYDDPEVQRDLDYWPFTLRNDGGIPKYEVVRGGLPESVSPEQVSAKVLGAMKATAEAYLEADVTKAVLTVPAYFNDAQRQATMVAGQLAGLEVVALLNEPVAAALAFGYEQKKNSTVLVFDLGGGTFDVTVLEICGDEYNIKAHGGDTHLGGQDFDNLLMKHIIEDVKMTKNVILTNEQDAAVFHDLRTSCELAKRKLSTLPESCVSVSLGRHGSHRKVVTRATFEDLCLPLFKKAIDYLPVVLKDAKVRVEEVDEVVLVGGSTRIPMVHALVQALFHGKKLNQSVNPDEAVALGAAIYAASMTGQGGARQIVMRDVSSLSLGVAQQSGVMAVLIPRNTPLPCQVTKPFTTASDQQEEAEIKICQGERALWRDNVVLGNCTLPVPARARGEVDIDTTFALDAGGVLTVSVVERSMGESVSLQVESVRNMTEREVQELVARAQRFRIEDDEAREQERQQRFKKYKKQAVGMDNSELV